MARRADHSRDELERMVVDATRAIVEDAGISGVTVRAIAKRIGYSPGTLYNLFANVDEIVMALNEQTLTAMGVHVMAAVQGLSDPFQRVRAMGAAYVRFAQQNRAVWLAVFEHRRHPGAAVAESYLARVGGLLGIVERELAPLIGPTDAATLAASARALWAGVHGISVLDATDRSDLIGGLGATEMADLLIVNFVRGARAGAWPPQDRPA